MTGNNSAAFFTSSNFNATIKGLISKYDQVFICSSNNEGILGLMALKDFDPSVVVIARLRSTRKAEISKIKLNHPVNILFYE